MAAKIVINFCGFVEHSKPNNMTLSDFIGTFPEGKKNLYSIYLRSNTYRRKMFCNLKSNWDHKLLIIESYIENSPMVVEL